ncbi:hypothetical protein GYB22_00015 [bacterium]|nr:hypothetical protein [bacterium]
MKLLFILLLFCFHLNCLSQFDEHFDSDLETNWYGDIEKFEISEHGLNSNSEINHDYFDIYRYSSNQIEYTLSFNLDFNTSSANYIDWFIQWTDTNNGYGYFVRIGDTKDHCVLYFRDSLGKDHELISGRYKTTEKAEMQLKIILTEQSAHLYRVYPDSVVLEGIAPHESRVKTKYSGLAIRQSTSSFFKKHLFHEMYAGEVRRDTSPPVLDSFSLERNQWVLHFNEPIKLNTVHISISPDLPKTHTVLGSKLHIKPDSMINSKYTLQISGISDTASNKMKDFELKINILYGSTPKPGDLIFNEILFNPIGDGPDYIELYNRSAHLIDLNGCVLLRQVDTIYKDEVFLPPILCHPGQFLLFSEDLNLVRARYRCGPDSNLVELKTPTMTNKEGTVLLLDSGFQMLDSITYSEDLHFSLLNSYDGVSLERISYEGNSWDVSIWQSSASIENFGTPGRQNSQLIENNQNAFQLISSLIQPNGNGSFDALQFQYRFSSPGYVIQTRIFDLSGNLVDRPLNQESMNTSGIYSWDGIKNDGSLIEAGNYVLLIHAIHPGGDVFIKKFAFTVLPI